MQLGQQNKLGGVEAEEYQGKTAKREVVEQLKQTFFYSFCAEGGNIGAHVEFLWTHLRASKTNTKLN